MNAPSSGHGPVPVLYCVDSDDFGGVERHTLNVLEHLDRTRFVPYLATTPSSLLAATALELGVRLVPVPAVRSKGDLAHWWATTRAVMGTKATIFHAMLSHSFACQYSTLAAIAARTPGVFATVHCPTAPSNTTQARLQRWLTRGVDGQIVPSRWVRAELGRLGQLGRRVEVVPNGISPPPALSREEARTALGLSPDAVVVGSTMRLVALKRPDVMAGIARAFPHVEVVVWGDGPERAALESSADDNLHLPGFRSDAATLLPAFDVFVNPCPVEAQGLAVLEAMVSGVPVVVADSGGVVESVDHERTGLLAGPTQVAFDTAVGRLLDDPALCSRLASAAVAAVEERFTSAVMTAHLEDLYEDLLRRR